MAKGKKTGGRNFKKGQRTKTKGRPPVPELVKQIRAADIEVLAQIITDALNMPYNEAAALLESTLNGKTQSTVFEFKVLQFLIAGGVQELQMLLTIVYGRPRQSQTPTKNILEDRIRSRMLKGEPAKIIKQAYKNAGIKK